MPPADFDFGQKATRLTWRSNAGASRFANGAIVRFIKPNNERLGQKLRPQGKQKHKESNCGCETGNRKIETRSECLTSWEVRFYQSVVTIGARTARDQGGFWLAWNLMESARRERPAIIANAPIDELSRGHVWRAEIDKPETARSRRDLPYPTTSRQPFTSACCLWGRSGPFARLCQCSTLIPSCWWRQTKGVAFRNTPSAPASLSQ
jgi:hypothetical protein